MTCALYVGTFDPVTLGHEDVILRASHLFSRVIVGVFAGGGSKQPYFSLEERLALLQAVCKGYTNVEVHPFSGLAVEFAKKMRASVFVRGLRTEADYVYEMQMAETNRVLHPQMDTLFFPTRHERSFISSTWVREIAKCGGDLKAFVSEPVRDAFQKKI